MGNTLTREIQRYLRESNENEAADFLNDGEIENYFIDYVSGMDESYDRHLYDITVFVPVRKYRSLGLTTEPLQNAIEEATREFAYSFGRLIKKFDWQPYLQDDDELKFESRAIDVVKLLGDSQYANSKIQILKNSIEKTPHLAIGTAKELMEICCKGILTHFNVSIDPDWELRRLVKETNKVLDFGGELNQGSLNQSIHLITGGLANITHGVTEMRNKFGSGHGHSIDFQELDKAYTHLVVYCAIEFVTFYQRIFRTPQTN